MSTKKQLKRPLVTDIVWLFDTFFHSPNVRDWLESLPKNSIQYASLEKILGWDIGTDKLRGPLEKVLSNYFGFLYDSKFYYGYIELDACDKKINIEIHNEEKLKNKYAVETLRSLRGIRENSKTLFQLIKESLPKNSEEFAYSSLQFNITETSEENKCAIRLKAPIWEANREFHEVVNFGKLAEVIGLRYDSTDRESLYSQFMEKACSLDISENQDRGVSVWVVPIRVGSHIVGDFTLFFDQEAKGDAQMEKDFTSDANNLVNDPNTYVIDSAVVYTKMVALRLCSALFGIQAIKDRQKATIPLPEMSGFQAKHGIIGQSKAIKDMCYRIMTCAKSREPLIILGESGTGKEIVARSIHGASTECKKIFFPFNCANFHRDTAASELFGSVEGAFTGAKNRVGLFVRTKGGTLFLDEIGKLPLNVQDSFLRALEAPYEITPVGSNEIINVKDVRVIIATNRHLAEMVVTGEFRHDLYHRLNVLAITVPPLNERRDDIPLLANHFLNEFNNDNNFCKKFEGFSEDALQALKNHDWTGSNVRVLKNTIKRAALFGTGTLIEKEYLELSHLPVVDGNDVGSSATPNHSSSAQKPDYWHKRLADAIGGDEVYKRLSQTRPTQVKNLLKHLPGWANANAYTASDADKARNVKRSARSLLKSIDQAIDALNPDTDKGYTFNMDFIVKNIYPK